MQPSTITESYVNESSFTEGTSVVKEIFTPFELKLPPSKKTPESYALSPASPIASLI